MPVKKSTKATKSKLVEELSSLKSKADISEDEDDLLFEEDKPQVKDAKVSVANPESVVEAEVKPKEVAVKKPRPSRAGAGLSKESIVEFMKQALREEKEAAKVERETAKVEREKKQLLVKQQRALEREKKQLEERKYLAELVLQRTDDVRSQEQKKFNDRIHQTRLNLMP